MVLDCLLALPRCGVASGWSKFSSKWLNKKFVQFSSPASSRWWTVHPVRFRARRLSDSVQFVQFSSRTVPALIVTLTLAGTRYYNILNSTRGVDVTPSSLDPDWAKAPVKKKTACCLLRDEADDTRIQGPASAVAVRLVSLRSDLWPENDISKVNRGHPRSFTCDEVISHFSGFCAPGDAPISHLKFIFRSYLSKNWDRGKSPKWQFKKYSFFILTPENGPNGEATGNAWYS